MKKRYGMQECKFKIYAKSLRGIRHRIKNMECQDQYAYEKCGGCLSVALVDGVGETDINAIAGKKIAEMVTDFFYKQAENIKYADEFAIAFNLMRQIQRMLDEMSEEYAVNVKELSSTLLGLYIDPQENYYIRYHLGDGVIATWDSDNCMHIVSEPQNGEKINETIVTTSDTALGNIRILKSSLDNVTMFVMATDGFYNSIIDKEALSEVFICKSEDAIMQERVDDQTIVKIVM
jgi:serine/threonine protein phosphatase PrpC